MQLESIIREYSPRPYWKLMKEKGMKREDIFSWEGSHLAIKAKERPINIFPEIPPALKRRFSWKNIFVLTEERNAKMLESCKVR